MTPEEYELKRQAYIDSPEYKALKEGIEKWNKYFLSLGSKLKEALNPFNSPEYKKRQEGFEAWAEKVLTLETEIKNKYEGEGKDLGLIESFKGFGTKEGIIMPEDYSEFYWWYLGEKHGDAYPKDLPLILRRFKREDLLEFHEFKKAELNKSSIRGHDDLKLQQTKNLSEKRKIRGKRLDPTYLAVCIIIKVRDRNSMRSIDIVAAMDEFQNLKSSKKLTETWQKFKEGGFIERYFNPLKRNLNSKKSRADTEKRIALEQTIRVLGEKHGDTYHKEIKKLEALKQTLEGGNQ